MEILAAALGVRMALVTCMAAETPGQDLDEYQVKAAFLYNFARFVEWPAEAFRGPGEPFSICILGEDPFGRALDGMVAGKAVGGRPIAVLRISGANQIDGCHILFVSSPASKRVLSILTTAKRIGVLTVGDAGTAENVIIGFVMESGKVRFEINTAAADRAVLHISAKLLSLARAIKR